MEGNGVLTPVKEMNSLGTKFDLLDLLWICKNLDLQSFKKRLKDARDRYDILMEKIILEHKEARNKNGAGADTVKDVLDILIDISEDENAEMKLTRENVKAFVMVMTLRYACVHKLLQYCIYTCTRRHTSLF
ncbi:hypothetical protein PTKIN_Ptkin06aG0085700 [Pterospermum kingtungense]